MGETSIEWTDRTWNPVRGCSMARGSETGGCLNCYAARRAVRHLWPGKAYGRMTPSGPRWTGEVDLIPEKLDEPLRWRKPARVFVNSMSDLFHEALPDEAIDRVFAVMAIATHHTFQILTKRPERMRAYLSDPTKHKRWTACSKALRAKHRPHSGGWGDEWWPRFAGHVWLGVSVEDQRTADERIPLLLETPAAVRFVSYEPALGPVDFTDFLWWIDPRPENDERTRRPRPAALDWVIVGGESGPGARAFDLAWARSVVAQCREAGVACFVKQLGRYPHDGYDVIASPGLSDIRVFRELKVPHPKGGDPAEWPEDLRVREFPTPKGR